MKIKLTQNLLLKSLVSLLIFSSSAYSTSIEIYKGVLVNETTHQAYLSNPNGGIDSIAIENGKINWHSNQADLPLLSLDSSVIAQLNTTVSGILKLANIDTSNGQLTQNHDFSLPENVKTNIQQSLESQFDLSFVSNQSTNANDSRINFDWQFTNKKAQGMLSEKTIKPLKISGGLLIRDANDITSGIVKVSNKNLKRVKQHIESKFLKNLDGRQFKSISGNHILISNMKQTHQIWDKYTWDLYDLKGQKLGSIDNFTSFRPFVVVSDLLVFVDLANEKLVNDSYESEALSLKAYSLKTSELKWKKEVRNLSYSGPYPH